MAPTVRQADDPGAHFVAEADANLARMDAALEHRAGAILEAGTRGIVGVHEQHASLATGDHGRDVVHPGVVRAHLAPADEQELGWIGPLFELGGERLDRRQHRRRAQMDLAVAVQDAPFESGLKRSEVDAVRRRA